MSVRTLPLADTLSLSLGVEPPVLDRVDLRDASAVISAISDALKVSLSDGDLNASVQLCAFLMSQLPDGRAVVADVLTPVVMDVCGNPADADAETLVTCAEVLERLRRPAASNRVSRVVLQADCMCRDALTLQLVALILDDLGVPAVVGIGPRDIDELPDANPPGAMCLAVCDPSQLPDVQPYVRAARTLQIPVVLAGAILADQPELADFVGATAGSWHPGDLTDFVAACSRSVDGGRDRSARLGRGRLHQRAHRARARHLGVGGEGAAGIRVQQAQCRGPRTRDRDCDAAALDRLNLLAATRILDT